MKLLMNFLILFAQMAVLVHMRSHKAFAEEEAHSQQSHGGSQQCEDDEKEREKL